MEDCFHLGIKALILKEGKILALETKKGWDLPGGRIQRNELVEDALRREVYEETGFQNIGIIKHLGMALSNRRIPVQKSNVGLVFSFYLCEVRDESPVLLSDEHIAYNWVEPLKVAELLAKSFPDELEQILINLVNEVRV